MTKLITSLALAVVVAIGFTGCATTGNTPPPMTQAQLEKAAALIKGTIRSALLVVVEKNGTNSQAYICMAAEVLNITLGGTNYTPGLLEKRLMALPYPGLKKLEVQLIISTVITAYEIYYADYVTDKLNGNVVAVTILTAIRDGTAGACVLSRPGMKVPMPHPSP